MGTNSIWSFSGLEVEHLPRAHDTLAISRTTFKGLSWSTPPGRWAAIVSYIKVEWQTGLHEEYAFKGIKVSLGDVKLLKLT